MNCERLKLGYSSVITSIANRKSVPARNLMISEVPSASRPGRTIATRAMFSRVDSPVTAATSANVAAEVVRDLQSAAEVRIWIVTQACSMRVAWGAFDCDSG